MAFERSMPLADAMHPEVMLAWQANGQDLLPQHGFPLRLIVPSWYGMASVKWLRAITVSDDVFQGVQVSEQYRYKTSASDPGTPVREKRVNSVITPPGIPDLISRFRFLAPGSYTITGKAWSGMGTVTSVEFSSDNGQTFQPATIRRPFSDANAWVAWSAPWAPTAGQYTSDAGQPTPRVTHSRCWLTLSLTIKEMQLTPRTVFP
jgi:DMSO/TMAO reductase YedYZ molybdopterin-dependent catalytic subunit